ncbi:MAG: hypothetical protein OK439_02760 [Thaumarchaeota archaeon]|nr:hypothetical protein [Nitrososphaerota archaeon]
MMQKPALKWPEKKDEENVESIRFAVLHKIIILVCSSLILVITSYGIVAALTGHINVVGATLVDFEFPPPAISPVFAKPISYLMVAGLALTFSGLELAKPHMAKFSKSQMSFIRLIAFIGIVLAGYEVLYNFAIWTAEIATNSLLGILNPDILLSPPSATHNGAPLNLVFATKLYTTLLAALIYVFYVVRQIERNTETIV